MATARTGTRDRILQASLTLFNDDGIARVSTHRIAAEAEISNGNLHYHFKTKQALVTALFRRFEDGLAPCIEAAECATALDDLWLSLHLLFEAVDRYRFIYRDIGHVLGECPDLEPRVQALTARQLLASKSLCVRMSEAGVLHASPEDLEMLALQIVFSTTCWFSFKRMVPRAGRGDHGEAALAAYYTLTLLSPYVRGPSREYLNYLRDKYLS